MGASMCCSYVKAGVPFVSASNLTVFVTKPIAVCFAMITLKLLKSVKRRVKPVRDHNAGESALSAHWQ
jgi:hypothetical protein